MVLVAGTLTKNDMEVVRAWVAGQDFRDLRAANACCQRQLQPGNASPTELDMPKDWASPNLGLDKRALDLLLSCICLNSTANLRIEGDTGESAAHHVKVERSLLEMMHSVPLAGSIRTVVAIERRATRSQALTGLMRSRSLWQPDLLG